MDYLPEWAKRELEELRRAPVGIAALFSLGIGAGWWAAGLFYSERIAVLQTRLESPASPSVGFDGAPKVRGLVIAGQAFGPRLVVLTINGASLVDFQRQHNVVAISGLLDASVDKFEDERISVSPTFTIVSQAIEIAVAYRGRMASALDELDAKNVANAKAQHAGAPKGSVIVVGMPTATWNEVILLPKGVSQAVIHRLSDVHRAGGLVLSQEIAEGRIRNVGP